MRVIYSCIDLVGYYKACFYLYMRPYSLSSTRPRTRRRPRLPAVAFLAKAGNRSGRSPMIPESPDVVVVQKVRRARGKNVTIQVLLFVTQLFHGCHIRGCAFRVEPCEFARPKPVEDSTYENQI